MYIQEISSSLPVVKQSQNYMYYSLDCDCCCCSCGMEQCKYYECV